MKSRTPPKKILIVDDDSVHRQMLHHLLEARNWQVQSCSDGARALQQAVISQPDLILLDIQMPGMNGYETCCALQKIETTRNIPVLFISGNSRPEEKVRAFEAGAVDFIAKPFHPEEIPARIRAHLMLSDSRKHYEELAARRMQTLTETLNRLKTLDRAKDQWLNVLSHEMRTPLTGIIGTAEYLFSELPPDSSGHGLRREFDLSIKRITKLIDDALMLTHIQISSTMDAQIVSCTRLLSDAIRDILRRHPEIRITLCGNRCAGIASIDPELLTRAYSDLLFTARCCTACNDEAIHIEREEQNGFFTVRFQTENTSLTAEQAESFFEVGGQRRLIREGGDFGLGPALAKQIAELSGGGCRIAGSDKHGISIEIKIPLADTASSRPESRLHPPAIRPPSASSQ